MSLGKSWITLPRTHTKLRNKKRIWCLVTAVWPTFVTVTSCSAYMVLTAMLQRRDGRLGAQLALILKIYSSGAFYVGRVSVQHWTLCLWTYLLNFEVLTLLGKLKATNKGCFLMITNTSLHVLCYVGSKYSYILWARSQETPMANCTRSFWQRSLLCK